MTRSINKITPCLWFDKEAGKAAKHYLAIFPEAGPVSLESFSDTPSGTVDIHVINLFGQKFMLINAGPMFKINEAISFVIDCIDQAEVDYYWEKLTADGGQQSRCGWLKDKFGVSWQIVPRRFSELMASDDKEKTGRVMQAMLKMQKLDIAELEKAYAGQ